MKNTIITIIVSLLAYSPWLVVTIKSIFSVAKDFWIKVIPDFNECVSFLFGSNCIPILFIILIFSTLLLFSKKYGGIKKFKFDSESTWICAGLLAILGAIIVTTVFSYIVRPILLTRYLYPVSIVAWMLFAFVVPRCTEKKKIICALVVALLFAGLINGAYTAYMERDADNSTNNILTSTSEISPDDVIYTNIQHMDWTMIDCYYDCAEHHYYDTTPTLGDRDTYWFFIDGKVNTNTLSEISSQGYNAELVAHDKFAAYTDPGFVNYYDVCAYKVTRA